MSAAESQGKKMLTAQRARSDLHTHAFVYLHSPTY